MKHALFAAVLLALTASVASGQSAGDAPAGEVFGGFSYLRTDTSENFSPLYPRDRDLVGAEVSGTYYIRPWFGAEVAYFRHTGARTSERVLQGPPLPPSSLIVEQEETVWTFMGGPKLVATRGPARVFGHALFGAVHGTQDLTRRVTGPLPDINLPSGDKKTTFGFAFGGGLDIALAPAVAIRPVQVDYVRGGESFSAVPRNSVRISTGVVLRFGG
jgi:opacity protein-like surface antigen